MTSTSSANWLPHAWLERKENVLLLGPPAVGKTRPAIALGTEASVAGSSIYFVTVQDLISQFSRARDENNPKERMTVLAKPKLLVLREMSYMSLDALAATCHGCLPRLFATNWRTKHGDLSMKFEVPRTKPACLRAYWPFKTCKATARAKGG